MKKAVFLSTIFAILILAGCRKIESDGQIQIVYVNQGGGDGSGSGNIVEIKGSITQNDTLKKANTYILKGLVYVKNRATLTIEPGTVIKGSYTGGDVAALIVTRGAKIMAKGTAAEPIVFTSASPNPQSGDWGGIVLLGKASVNTSFNSIKGLFQAEGGIDNANGDGIAGSGDAVAPTPVDNDTSGVLSYVRIEYAGYAFQPDKELNSLTMCAVGSGTTIDHVQVAYAKDDAFEWFGGTVNCKYLIAYKTQDDDFDTDNGYSGNVQFGISLRDPNIADVSKSEAFESDNDANGTSNTPKTAAVFSNMTVLGPLATGAASHSSLFRAGAHIRRNTEISILNSVFIGWNLAIEVDGTTGNPTGSNVGSKVVLANNFLGGNVDSVLYSNGADAYRTADLIAYFKDAAQKNEIMRTMANNLFVTYPFTFNNFDPTPFGNAAKIVGTPLAASPTFRANITHAKMASSFFTKTDPATGKDLAFIGAVAPGGELQTWWKGWTKFN